MGRLVFPTRQPVLRERLESLRQITILNDQTKSAPVHDEAPPDGPPIDRTLNRFLSSVVGIDNPSRPMIAEEIRALGDRFTRDMILQDAFPLTLREFLDEVAALNGEKALPVRQLFLVAEGAQHRGAHPDFPLNARLVYTWQSSDTAMAELLLSTVPHLDEPSALMQVMAWSETDGAYHFFERVGAVWTWAGNGFHAFNPKTRGIGPFDSHINGGLVMKELKFPWAHWHSQSNTIPVSMLTGTDFGQHPALSKLDRAEDLEPIVQKANRSWAKSRVRRDQLASRIADPVSYMRQVLEATSVNLISSDMVYSTSLRGRLRLPKSFFMDTDSIGALARRLRFSANPIAPVSLSMNATDYVAAITELEIGVQMNKNGPRVVGDTHFCFLVPERAFEDHVVVMQLQRSKLASARFLLCLLLVDFSNPVESRAREVLIRHTPDQPLDFSEHAFDNAMLPSIRSAAGLGSTVEQEFLHYWDAEDLEVTSKVAIDNFQDALVQKLSDAAGVLEITKLAEARRNRFRKRDLHEFDATVARSRLNIPDLYMNARAEIFTLGAMT